MEDETDIKKRPTELQHRLDRLQMQTKQHGASTHPESRRKTLLQDREERLRRLEEFMRRAS